MQKRWAPAWILAGILLFAGPVPGAPEGAGGVVTGTVVDELSSEPVADARVRIQATTGAPFITGPDGTFTIGNVPGGQVTITAVPSFDSQRAVNYITGSVQGEAGQDLEIRLTPLPEADRPNYDPGTSINCASCHANQHGQWINSTHGNAAVNEWVLDLFSGDGTPGGSAGYVFIDTHDPDDTGFCATCHAPLEDAQDPGNVFLNQVQTAGGLDGVTCLACHQMAEVNDNVSALHHLGNTQYRFPQHFATELWVWGPLDDVSFNAMRASYQPGFTEARFCASCHEYNNPDTGAPGQNTYSEWLASPFSDPGEGFRACQDCHMPPAAGPGPIATIGGQPVRSPERRRNHSFIGATQETLTGAIDLALDAWVEGGRLVVRADVTNHGAGHHFPTGISIRNAFVVIEASVDGQPLAQAGGEVIPFYGSADGQAGPDDLAGRPGRGFARILEGRINGQGPVVRPVLFIDAENVWADTRIPSGETDSSTYSFSLEGVPEQALAQVSARVLYRRAFRNLSETKGWTVTPAGGPIETLVAEEGLLVDVQGVEPPRPVPALGLLGLVLLSLIVLAVAVRAISGPGRRRPGSPR